MMVYNGEAHGLGKPQNRKDWAIRMQHFFDHSWRSGSSACTFPRTGSALQDRDDSRSRKEPCPGRFAVVASVLRCGRSPPVVT